MSANLKNPFPGMNPWLEAHWHSAHSRFLTYASDQISSQLLPGLAALTWPSPALPDDEQAWAEQLLGEKGFLPG